MASSVTCDDARDLLRSWREDNVRRSEEVIEFYEDSLRKNMQKLGAEVWLVYEQVCIAALDCHRIDIAQECLKALCKQFPKSLRVANLQGMLLEALERYDEAIKLYDSITKQDEASLLPRKRKVAILKAQSNIPEAVKELTEYLKKFMSDQEAWMELCDLYVQEQEYNKAAFCIEELILFNPHNHLYHQRYAEIRYTQGGLENMELARSYFAQAIKLNPNNTRALYGLLLAASNIAASPKCTAPKKKENMNYAKWASKQISDKHKAKCDGEDGILLKVVTASLSSLQIS